MPKKVFLVIYNNFKALNSRFDIADHPSVFDFKIFRKKNIFAKFIPDSDLEGSDYLEYMLISLIISEQYVV